MLKECRSCLLYAFSILAVMMFANAALADYNCYSTCDPYTSSCDQYCEVCMVFTQDGFGQWEESTCGDALGACIPGSCSPSWYESSRVTQGTYGNGSMFSCSHHSVQWVGVTDANHCNINEYYYTYHYCDDVLDGGKSGWFPDCCDGNPYSCNNYHNCTG